MGNCLGTPCGGGFIFPFFEVHIIVNSMKNIFLLLYRIKLSLQLLKNYYSPKNVIETSGTLNI